MTKTAPQIKVEESVAAYVKKFNEAYNLNMKTPEVVFDVSSFKQLVVGGAVFGTNQVFINPDVLNAETDKVLRSTVPHEVAHMCICFLQIAGYLSPRLKHHGRVFTQMMQFLGASKEDCGATFTLA